MNKFSKVYVGLDVHKATIAIAVAGDSSKELRYYGEIENTPDAMRKRVKRLSTTGEVLNFCYEVRPCGYGLYRDLRAQGHACIALGSSRQCGCQMWSRSLFGT